MQNVVQRLFFVMSPTEALNPAPLLKPGPGRKHICVSLPCSTIKSRSLKMITSTLCRSPVSTYCGGDVSPPTVELHRGCVRTLLITATTAQELRSLFVLKNIINEQQQNKQTSKLQFSSNKIMCKKSYKLPESRNLSQIKFKWSGKVTKVRAFLSLASFSNLLKNGDLLSNQFPTVWF